MEVPMEQVVEQLKACREHNREMLRVAAISLGVCYSDDILSSVKKFSMEAEACNAALRAILGDYWEEMEELENE
jgi:hypothetical protein